MSDDKITIQKLLLALGFSRAEAETYWALLNLDAVSIRRVAAFSGINRGTTYDALKSLVVAGLVATRTVGAREYFTAEPPDTVNDLIREKRKDLLAIQQNAQKLIPELKARKARPQGQPLVKYYQDDEGIVAILRDVLQTCSKLKVPEYCAISSKPLRQYLYRKFPQFTERRVREGVAVKVIAVGEGGDPADNSERKWLTKKDDQNISSYTIIYGDKVALISISNNTTPYGVVIEDAGTASMQKLLFMQVWSRL